MLIVLLVGIVVLLLLLKKEGFVDSIRGRYIILTRPQAGWFNLAEIQVFSERGGKNIITPSTDVSMPDSHPSYPPSRFVDGDQNSIFHNANAITGGPLTVDLGASVPIFKIVVINRSDCCKERASGTVLTIQNENRQVIYTADPVTDKSGNATYTELGGNMDTQYKYYHTFTYFPPEKTMLGDFVDLSMSGPQGPQGPQGPAGIDGKMGPAGPAGQAGSAGPQGQAGSAGPQGQAGIDGKMGPAGPQGPAGVDGQMGQRGLMGQMGPMYSSLVPEGEDSEVLTNIQRKIRKYLTDRNITI